MAITRTHTRTHVLVGFANPYLVCDECRKSVPYWHNPDRCGCEQEGFFNHPCKHKAGVSSICYSWNPIDGCMCSNKETHDR